MNVNLEYITEIQLESLKLRREYPTLKKAKKHAKEILPKEPISLVEKYLGGNQPESKASVIARKYSRFTKPAYPVEANDTICRCSGKCATVRCSCKALLSDVHIKHTCKSCSPYSKINTE